VSGTNNPVAEIVKVLYFISRWACATPPFPTPSNGTTPSFPVGHPVCGSVWLSCYFRSFVCGSPYPVFLPEFASVCVVWLSRSTLDVLSANTKRSPHFPTFHQHFHPLFRLILYLLSLDSTVVWVTCLDGVDGKGISANGIE